MKAMDPIRLPSAVLNIVPTAQSPAINQCCCRLGEREEASGLSGRRCASRGPVSVCFSAHLCLLEGTLPHLLVFAISSRLPPT